MIAPGKHGPIDHRRDDAPHRLMMLRESITVSHKNGKNSPLMVYLV
jgi:hypothetical protein